MNGKIRLNFKENFFNKIFHEINDVFLNKNIRFCFIYGGSSASKTFSYVQRTIIYMLEGNDNNSLVFRKFSTDIDDSIFTDFKNIIDDWGLSQYFIIQKHFVKCKITGSYTKFKGLDDPEKIKGLSGIKKICLEELSQFDFDDFKQVKKRLRGEENQQIFGIFNPVSEKSFIKNEIFDKDIWTKQNSGIQEKLINEIGNSVILRTCYLDNTYIVGPEFVDQHTIDDFENDKKNDINYYNIYALGHWGKLRTGGEFFKKFKTDKHVRDIVYNENLPLHICFDENVLPYLTCNIFQFNNGKLSQIDEVMLKDPLNTLKDTCEEVIRRYGKNNNGLFVYGDATSRKSDGKLEKGMNFFLLVKGYLQQMKPNFRVPKSNPSVLMSRNFTNSIFNNEIEGISFEVNKECRNSIHDYEYCTEDENGGVNKRTIKDKVTGQTYQEFGHASDCLRYIVTVLFMNDYKIFIKGGKN